ncbi:MAG: BatA domain-containing protein [Verrucomicrobiota bacterium]
MTFLAPWLLLGTLLTGVPLAIHLLNKPRYRRHAWGAMMFLETALEKRSRTIKFQQLLLLILRMLIPALLAWALARPVIRSDRFFGGGSQPTTHLLVLDGSYSMRQGQNRQNAFQNMIETSKKIVESMTDQDNAMIIWAGNRPRALTPRPVFNRADLKRVLDDLTPGWEKADMPRALEQAMWMFSLSRLPRRRIYVLSDLQQAGWEPGDETEWNRFNKIREDKEIAPAIYTIAQQSPGKTRNIAVTELRTRYPLLDIHRTADFMTEIHNYLDEDQQAEITFIIDGQEVERKQVTLKTGVNTEHFKHRFTKPGSYAIEILVQEDDLPVDNRKSLAVEVLQTIPILIIEGVPDNDDFASPGTMLEWALEAGSETENENLFDVARISETELDSLSYSDLINYKSILLVNVRSLAAEFAGALKQYVREGGGLLVGLGDDTPPEQYNSLYEGNRGLMPARIGKLRNSGEKPWSPSFPAGPAREILQLFDVTRARTLENIQARTFRRLEPAPETTIAGLLADNPFLAIKNYGKGCVSLWSLSFNLEWSNMPAAPDFVPLMQNLVFHLSSQVIPPINLNQNETLVYSYSRSRSLIKQTGPAGMAADRPETCRVVDPEGKEHNIKLVTKMGESIAYFGDTVKPGLYTVQAEGAPPRTYSVSLPAGEGNPAALTSNEKKWISDSANIRMVDNIVSLRRAIENETGVNDLCSQILAATLLALAAESILAAKCSGEKQKELQRKT